jgi:hypothetical protein
VLKANESDVPFRGVQLGRTEASGAEPVVASESEISEDECPFPMPEDPPEEPTGSNLWNETPEQTSMRLYRQMKFWTAQNEWESRPKPEWWSQAWEEMAEVKRPDGTRIPTGSPKDFKEDITGDMFVTDRFAFQSHSDGIFGQDILPSVSLDLTNVVAVGVWNESGTTMIRKCGRDVDINELSLAAFKEVLAATPDACELTYATNSEWLLEQWLDMLAWKSIDYQGLDRKACPHYWQDIMGHAETRLSRVTMVSASEMPVREDLRSAVQKFGMEGLEWYQRFMETPDGAEYPPVAPLR